METDLIVTAEEWRSFRQEMRRRLTEISARLDVIESQLPEPKEPNVRPE